MELSYINELMITLPGSPVLSRGGNTARTFFIAIEGMAV